MDDTVSGVVVHIRKSSKKLAFFDVETGEKEEKKRITVVFKTWECKDLLLKAIKGDKKIHVGDNVSFKGYPESETEFCVLEYQILQLWSETNPGVNFIPRPPELSVKSEAVCKQFLNTGRCSREKCHFQHLEQQSELIEKRVKFVKEKKERQILVHEGDLEKNDSIVNKSQRSRIYSEWIVNKYGLEYLKSGLILDIAGGRGDLSFELTSKFSLNCVIVDPRPQKFRKWQIKLLKKNPDFKPPTHILDYFDENFFSKHEDKVKLENIRLVVGLHPDEATEPLVDNALINSLKFSVIPCCVFSSKFPKRRLKRNIEPVSYELFCEYICEKFELISKEILPFVGKNYVFFVK